MCEDDIKINVIIVRQNVSWTELSWEIGKRKVYKAINEAFGNLNMCVSQYEGYRWYQNQILRQCLNQCRQVTEFLKGDGLQSEEFWKCGN